jgi:hypothetical protein
MHGDIVEQFDTDEADFWSVFGHYREGEGGLECFEGFLTEAEAEAFHDRLLSI